MALRTAHHETLFHLKRFYFRGVWRADAATTQATVEQFYAKGSVYEPAMGQDRERTGWQYQNVVQRPASDGEGRHGQGDQGASCPWTGSLWRCYRALDSDSEHLIAVKVANVQGADYPSRVNLHKELKAMEALDHVNSPI